LNKTTITRTLQVITVVLIGLAWYSNHQKEAAAESARLQEAQKAEQEEVTVRAANVAKAEADQRASKPHRAELLTSLKKEPKVKDVSWLNEHNNSILVGVLNDGSRQDGYAGYICSLMVDHELYGGIVRIMDVAAATRDKWTELGRADCMTKEQASTVTMVEFGPNGKIKKETVISREEFNRQLSK
jgi:hypothetical protein